jgi:hypothetical protein
MEACRCTPSLQSAVVAVTVIDVESGDVEYAVPKPDFPDNAENSRASLKNCLRSFSARPVSWYSCSSNIRSHTLILHDIPIGVVGINLGSDNLHKRKRMKTAWRMDIIMI